jgi:CheY-like chemotaxis protein
MNGVIGMTGLLLDTKLTTEQREYAETIRRSGDALLEIINDILDFSKIEAGKLHLDSMNFDLWTTVEEVIAMFAEQAETKGLEMACVIPVDVPHALRGDPGRLRQILTNLVGNAVKFTAKGEVVVRVTVAEAQVDGVLVRFEVTDTGIGISPEGRAHLFQTFSQVDGSTTRRYGGTGLGLAICKKLTELMGGEIGIESAEGQGSTVWFTARLEKQSGPAAAAPTSRPHLHGVRALIVDDNKTNRTILTHQVGAWGMRGESADDGPQALELLRAAAGRGEPFQLAILDMMMPGMDGLQLARAIKADPALKSVRLVMLSSFRQLGRAEEARQAGIEAYLTKPVRHSWLHDALSKVMGGPAPLPLPGRPGMGAKDAPQSPTRPQAGRSRGRILVVEDSIVNQRVAVRMLEKLGYRVDVAADGREGLDMLSRTPYTAVLMDCQMPEMDGFEATAEIRRREAMGEGQEAIGKSLPSSLTPLASRHIPIIAMTANAMQGDREKCLAVGMDDYIAKPVKLELFEEVLSRWIKPAAPSSGRAFIETTAPASPDRTLQPPLDPTVLADLRALGGEDDPEFLNRAIGCFLRDTPKRLVVVRDAVGQGNARALEQAAHSLKGSCSNIGARQMVALCLALEERGRAGSVKGAETLLAPLDNAFARVREVIEGDKVQANPGSKA